MSTIQMIPAGKQSGEYQNGVILTLTLKDSQQNELLTFTRTITGMHPDVIASTILSALVSLTQPLTSVFQEPGSCCYPGIPGPWPVR